MFAAALDEEGEEEEVQVQRFQYGDVRPHLLHKSDIEMEKGQMKKTLRGGTRPYRLHHAVQARHFPDARVREQAAQRFDVLAHRLRRLGQ